MIKISDYMKKIYIPDKRCSLYELYEKEKQNKNLGNSGTDTDTALKIRKDLFNKYYSTIFKQSVFTEDIHKKIYDEVTKIANDAYNQQ